MMLDVTAQNEEQPVVIMYYRVTFYRGRPGACRAGLAHQWAPENCAWKQLCDAVAYPAAVDKL